MGYGRKDEEGFSSMANLKFAVLGTGNSGQCFAADIALKGYSVNLAEIPEFAANLEAQTKRPLKVYTSFSSVVRPMPTNLSAKPWLNISKMDNTLSSLLISGRYGFTSGWMMPASQRG